MNISAIMSSIVPGTFVPDLGVSEKPTITAIPAVPGSAGITDSAIGGSSDAMPAGIAGRTGGADSRSNGAMVGGVSSVHGETSFKDTVKQFLGDVNDKLNTSDQNTRDLASGKTNDINKVVTSVEEANLSLQYAISIRSKLLAAYSEIDRMTV